MPNRDKVDWEAAYAMQDRDKMFLLYAVSESLCKHVGDFSAHSDGAVEEEVQRLVGAGFLMESDGRLNVTKRGRFVLGDLADGTDVITDRKATGIDRFLAEIREILGTPAFRGHADNKWKLHSSATHRLIREYEEDDILEDDLGFSKMYANYHFSELIQPARMNGHGVEDGNRISDLELLARLQHLGAATGLIDFTWNPIVALWFACRAGREDGRDWDKCDGTVFVINLNDPTQFQIVPNEIEKQTVQAIFPREPADSPYYWEPPPRGPSAPRILRQRSVFVIGRPLIPEHVVKEIVIPEADKKEIRRELEERLDTNELSLFMDIHGFSVANRPESPIRRMDDPIGHFQQGNRSYQQGDYSRAIGGYDRCIRSKPDAWEPYMARGNAKAEIQRFSDARKDYDSALHCRGSLYYDDEPSINLIQVTMSGRFFTIEGI